LGDGVLLLVLFTGKSEGVWSGWPDRLQTLEKMLLEGGTPVGMLSLHDIDGERHFSIEFLKSVRNINGLPLYDQDGGKPGEIITLTMNAFKTQTDQKVDMN
jgi:hypothetical protein